MSYTVNCTEDGVVRYPMHTHKRYEIMLYLMGEGEMRTEFGSIPFSKGTVVIVPPNIKHGSLSKEGFRNISVEGNFEGYFHFTAVKALRDNDLGEGEMLARMIYENRYGSQAYLAALCMAYACFLARRSEAQSALQSAVQGIVSEISERALDSQIDLASILSQSGYSEDYIRSRFKQTTGKTPHEFLTDIRIRHACFLTDIYRGELSLSDIAERCGYLDYVYFSKVFKSVMGVSPREYKRQGEDPKHQEESPPAKEQGPPS